MMMMMTMMIEGEHHLSTYTAFPPHWSNQPEESLVKSLTACLGTCYCNLLTAYKTPSSCKSLSLPRRVETVHISNCILLLNNYLFIYRLNQA